MTELATNWIEDDAVTEAKLATSVAGDGLTGGGGSPLAVNVDDSTVEIATDVVQVKALGIDTAELAAQAVTAAKLGAVVGNGLTGGAGSAIAALDDSTGGANLASSVNVSANGLAVKVDDDTIGEDGSSRLKVNSDSIGATEIDETDTFTWSGVHDFQTGTIHVPTPTSDTHAVTKAYADALRQGVAIKDPCRAMNDANEALTGDPGTVDGVTTWVTGQRMLLTNQSSADENGIWEVDTTGAWNRPTDFDTGDSAAGAQTWINSGTAYGDSQWTCTDDTGSDVIDTDALTFVQTSGAGQITAGTCMVKIGNTFHIGTSGTTGDINGINRSADNIAAAVDDTTIAIVSNLIQIKDLGVGSGQLAATSVTAAKLGSDVAGDGLSGGNGSDLDVDPDTTGGANLATVVNAVANGVSIKIDSSTIGENGSNQLFVPNGGITETQINASAAGNGISGGGGSAFALDINGIATAEATPDNADLIAIYDNSNTDIRKMTRANFLSGVAGENIKQEMHLITSGETISGYFTLAETPTNAQSVRVNTVKGIMQVSKQVVGATGASPDFDVLSSTQLHFNNNGAATGLTAKITTGDILMVRYQY